MPLDDVDVFELFGMTLRGVQGTQPHRFQALTASCQPPALAALQVMAPCQPALALQADQCRRPAADRCKDLDGSAEVHHWLQLSANTHLHHRASSQRRLSTAQQCFPRRCHCGLPSAMHIAVHTTAHVTRAVGHHHCIHRSVDAFEWGAGYDAVCCATQTIAVVTC